MEVGWRIHTTTSHLHLGILPTVKARAARPRRPVYTANPNRRSTTTGFGYRAKLGGASGLYLVAEKPSASDHDHDIPLRRETLESMGPQRWGWLEIWLGTAPPVLPRFQLRFSEA